MSKKYINNDYTLNIYAKNAKDHKSLVPNVVTEQQVTTEQQQVNVVTAVDFTNATGSLQESGGQYSYANMIFASRSMDDSIGFSNRLFTHPKIGDETSADGTFGRSVVISGATMVVNSRQRNDIGAWDTRSMRNRQGVFVFKSSSSSGWEYSDAVIPASSLYPIATLGDGPQPAHVAKNFHMHNNFIAISAPLTTTLGVTLVYKSSSSGWAHDGTIGTGSFSPTYWVQSDATSADALTYYIYNSPAGVMPSVKVFGNKLVIGGVSAKVRPNSGASWSTNQIASAVAMFARTSANEWQFEQILTSSLSHTASAAVDEYQRKGMGVYPGHFNGAIDFDGTRVVAAGQGGYDSITWQSENGRISIFNSSSTGWYEEDQIDLRSAGFTGSVSATLTPSSPDITSGVGEFAGNNEWKLYTEFGFYSCAISGSYLAATAKGYPVSSNSPRIPNRVFIFKSSSAGWKHEVDFNSPNSGTGGDGTHMSASYADEFGYTLIFNRSVPGMLATRSPSYRPDPSNSNNKLGRVHIYKSSSASGWGVYQNIDNPYSGSAISYFPGGSSNYRDDYWEYGDHAGYGTEGAGDYLDAVATGFDSGHLAVPFSGITESENDTGAYGVQQRFGAVQILSGALAYTQDTVDVQVTESVQVTNYVLTSSILAPFVKAVNLPVNIRLQSGSSTPFSSEFGSSKTLG